MIKFRLCTIITVAGVIDNELVFKFQLAEKSTWRNGKSLHLSKTNCTQVKDQSTASESFLFGSESTWIRLLTRLRHASKSNWPDVTLTFDLDLWPFASELLWHSVHSLK